MRLKNFLQNHLEYLHACGLLPLCAPIFGLSPSFMLSRKQAPLRVLQIILFPPVLQGASLVVYQLS